MAGSQSSNPLGAFQSALALFRSHFSDQPPATLEKVFAQIQNLFEGRYPGYQGCDTAYHDLTHTCLATEAAAQILSGHIKSGAPPELSTRDFELAVVATLLHDTGYFKQTGDNHGTGAKYTLVHVERSCTFAAAFLKPLGFTPEEVHVVQTAIRCTGVGVNMSKLKFDNERAKFIGCALAAGDLLSQMAAPDYPQRLPELYREFAEAADYSNCRGKGIGSYHSPEDLMSRTRGFFDNYVKPMLDTHWSAAQRALGHFFPKDRNPYIGRIVANLDRIDELLAAQNAGARR